MNVPSFQQALPDLARFIHRLMREFESNELESWEALHERTFAFFTAEQMDVIEQVIPHWQKMASYIDGITLDHVTCVFVGMYMLPEYRAMTRAQQDAMNWVILFHDVEKEPQYKKRDHTHAFRSTIHAARTLPRLGFPVTDNYSSRIDAWERFTREAVTTSEAVTGPVQDNRKFPGILEGIETMFGRNTPATLILKTILFHLSIDMQPWPAATPLTEAEMSKYLDRDLLPYLEVMHLADSEGWNLFNPKERHMLLENTRKAFRDLERLLEK